MLPNWPSSLHFFNHKRKNNKYDFKINDFLETKLELIVQENINF